ncbi:allantoinase [Mycobacterium sp. djl-10]|nr:allantoinase [Mycobacterium sp. djl-10]
MAGDDAAFPREVRVSHLDLVLHADNAIVDDAVRSVSVGIRDGVIAVLDPEPGAYRVGRQAATPQGSVLMPGLVDTHVHVNDPGTDWEGFATATAAAAAGGVTTIVDMPLDCDPVTTSTAALAAKRVAAEGHCRVSVGFWGGVVPENVDTPQVLAELRAAGCSGFKCFLADSGNPAFPPLDADQLGRAMEAVAALDSVLLVHAELLPAATVIGGPAYVDFLNSRPDAAEVSAVSLVLEQARRTGARTHIVHVSSAEVLPLLAAAKADGLPVTAETCPHYLSFDTEQIPCGATEYAVCPPIRHAGNREQLWEALGDGVLDMVVSDHSPCAPHLKPAGDFGAAFGGISSLQLGLRAVWTQARRRGVALPQVCRWMAARPAALAGLTDRGRIAVGTRADLTVFDPAASEPVDATRLHHRHPVTPYHGRHLDGAVLQTWVAGRRVDTMVAA